MPFAASAFKVGVWTMGFKMPMELCLQSSPKSTSIFSGRFGGCGCGCGDGVGAGPSSRHIAIFFRTNRTRQMIETMVVSQNDFSCVNFIGVVVVVAIAAIVDAVAGSVF